MAQVTVTIGGVSHQAVLTWNGALKTLTNAGGGGFTTSFPSGPGTFVYSITVFGAPSDPWTAKVTDDTNTNNHAGHMSPGGFDTTGDTQFVVT